MTVIPFPAGSADRWVGPGPRFRADAAVSGEFGSPSGRTGRFTGAYRLERFVTQFGHLAAAGVFTGELTEADGTPVGVGSRRHTAAVELVAGPGALVARIGPLDVNLLGLLVGVDEFEMQVRRNLPADGLVPDGEPSQRTEGMPPSAAELIRRLMPVHDAGPTPPSTATGRAR